MLSMLDTNRTGNYRVPYSILNTHNAYAIAAYIATMRFSTRFGETTGSIRQYLEYFGYKLNPHIGASNDRMKSGLTELAKLKVIDMSPTEAADLKPNEHFCIDFKPNWGWTYKEYPLAIMYPIKEIDKAVQLVQNKKWGNQDSIIEILELVGFLRSYMETTTETLSPYERWNQAVAIVDYKSTTTQLNLTNSKLTLRLDRMKELNFGRYRKIKLKGGPAGSGRFFLLFVNRTDSNTETAVLNKAKRNLLNFYKGSKIIKVETDGQAKEEEE